MMRFAVLGAGMILLSGCALPVPVQIASWALDGVSYLFTEKSVADHGISVLAQKDCAVLRGLLDPGKFCRDFDDTATALADGGSYASVLFGDGTDPDDDGGAAIAEFETAAGGDALDSVDETGALTNARPIIDDGIGGAAEMIDLSVAFEEGTGLTGYPLRVVATGPSPEASLEAAADGWRARTITRVAEAGQEPAAGIYFVIGSFREHVNARKLRNKYRVLTPSVLAAKLGRASVYRVVVGPIGRDQAKGIHQRITRAGISDSWAIRVMPGEWSMAMVDPPALAPVEVAVLGRPAEDFEWSAANSLARTSPLVY